MGSKKQAAVFGKRSCCNNGVSRKSLRASSFHLSFHFTASCVAFSPYGVCHRTQEPRAPGALHAGLQPCRRGRVRSQETRRENPRAHRRRRRYRRLLGARPDQSLSLSPRRDRNLFLLFRRRRDAHAAPNRRGQARRLCRASARRGARIRQWAGAHTAFSRPLRRRHAGAAFRVARSRGLDAKRRRRRVLPGTSGRRLRTCWWVVASPPARARSARWGGVRGGGTFTPLPPTPALFTTVKFADPSHRCAGGGT